jgi:hypothetical protein
MIRIRNTAKNTSGFSTVHLKLKNIPVQVQGVQEEGHPEESW